MQAIASWNNLAETTFLLPPTQAGADYRLRIFTTRQEIATFLSALRTIRDPAAG